MLSYIRLCRIDVALIAFISYLFGAELAGGTDWYDIVVALLVTMISTNFIYSFNSWTDREIDRISKPYRPIPSGKI
ncbi:MAG: UbiA family prenyltransferase, partial [Desulfobacterales bacterium]